MSERGPAPGLLAHGLALRWVVRAVSPRRAGDPAAIVASNDRIRAALGWAPKHDDLRAIVGQALDWERRLHNRAGE